MIRVEKKSWGGWLCSCAHHLHLERPRPSLVVPGLQNPVRWLRKTCRHSGGLGDEQGAVGMGLGGQGTHFDRNALGCATGRLSDQCIAKPRKGQSEKLAGASAQTWRASSPSGGTSFGAEFMRIKAGEGE